MLDIDIRLQQSNAYNTFIKENPTMVGISERAMRPLINEKAPDISAMVKQKIGMGLSRGHPLEAENIKHIIDELKEGKVKSGRSVKNSNEKIIERDEEVDISKAIRPVEEAKAKKSVKKQNFKY